jgi:hypothetical protein
MPLVNIQPEPTTHTPPPEARDAASGSTWGASFPVVLRLDLIALLDRLEAERKSR